MGTDIKAFSLSLIAGALGDAGQNYKNIIMAMEAVDDYSGGKYRVRRLGNSCPPPDADDDTDRARHPHQQHSKEADPSGSCGQDPTPADCENVDFGSCGNACCHLEVYVRMKPKEAMESLRDALSEG